MTTLTTPEALELLAKVADDIGGEYESTCEQLESIHDHLASRIAELEAELAAAKVDSEWSAKMAEFIGPGALAYMWREFNAAREGK